MTRTRVPGSPSARASALARMDGAWDEAHTVSASPSQSATSPRGSSGEAAQRACSKVSRTITGAAANAASTSPWLHARRNSASPPSSAADALATTGSGS
jgi:hypothetical protein